MQCIIKKYSCLPKTCLPITQYLLEIRLGQQINPTVHCFNPSPVKMFVPIVLCADWRIVGHPVDACHSN